VIKSTLIQLEVNKKVPAHYTESYYWNIKFKSCDWKCTFL